MARKKVDIQEDQVRKLLRGPEVFNDIRRRVNAIAAAAGPGFQASVVVGRNRVRGSVITTNQRSRLAEARNRALTRALDAGRN